MNDIFQPWRKFQPENTGEAYGWLQWKGTDVCMDIHCTCGALGHLHGLFAYTIKCGHCGKRYELSGHIEFQELIGPHEDGACEDKVFWDEDISKI